MFDDDEGNFYLEDSDKCLKCEHLIKCPIVNHEQITFEDGYDANNCYFFILTENEVDGDYLASMLIQFANKNKPNIFKRILKYLKLNIFKRV